MIPTKEEYKIISDYFISIIDWDRIYRDTASESRKMFTKEDIIKSLKKLISEYPYYDTSVIEGRVEEGVSTLAMRKGSVNNYMYMFSGIRRGDRFWWFMTDDKLFEAIEKYKDDNRYCIIIDIKEYLRNHKIKKICQTLIKITNSTQE